MRLLGTFIAFLMMILQVCEYEPKNDAVIEYLISTNYIKSKFKILILQL